MKSTKVFYSLLVLLAGTCVGFASDHDTETTKQSPDIQDAVFTDVSIHSYDMVVLEQPVIAFTEADIPCESYTCYKVTFDSAYLTNSMPCGYPPGFTRIEKAILYRSPLLDKRPYINTTRSSC